MFKNWNTKLNVALSLALVLAMTVTVIVLADNVITDGDGLTPVVDTPSLSLGNVCTGSTTSKTILHAISRNGNYPSTNVFVKGATVTVSIGTVTGSGLSASGGGSILLPSNWDMVANNTLSNSVSSSVNFIAGSSPMSFTGTVNYSASGLGGKNLDEVISRTDSLIVTANVVSCDTTPPTLNLPTNMTVEATSASGAIVTFTATADDANPAHPAVTCSPASGSVFPLDGTTTVNCSATDAAGNTANDTFIVTVGDTTPPTITPPSDVTVEAAGGSGAVVTYSGESASDLVDGTLTATCDPASGSIFPLGGTTVTCLATDSHGNTGSSTFTIEVQDTTAPVLILPGDIIVEATGPDGAPADFSVSASDLVDGAVSVTCDANSGDTFALGSTTVSCSTTDSNDNTASGSFMITVVDTTAPDLTLPGGVTEEATGPSGADVAFSATASDLVDGSVIVTCTPASGSTFALGSTTVNCSASDAAGNSATGSFDVTVQDTTPPTLTLPADQQLEATGPTGAVASFAATASDLVDGDLTVICDANSGDTFPLGTNTVNCSVTDAAGNLASGSFIIIVEDTTPPVIAAHADVTAEATGASGATVSYASPATSDAVDGPGIATCAPASGTQLALGDTTVMCNATDAAGNAATPTTFVVHVVDTTPPVVTVPADITVEATGPSGAVVTFSATASDIVDGSVPVTCSPASGSTFPLGTTTVNCSATDAHNNTGTSSFKVSVVDTTPPALTLPDDITAEATGPSGTAVSFTTLATDLVDGAVAVSCIPASSNTFPLGTTSVTCSATDAHNNVATGSFNVIVVDTTPPVVTVPADKTVEATGPSGAIATFAASASDIVNGALTPTCIPASGSTFPLGTSPVTCSATDAAGNTGSASFDVTVVDTTPPVLTVPDDMTMPATSPAGAVVTFSATAIDLVDPSPSVTCLPPSGSTFAPGTTLVSCITQDFSGNTSTKTFNIRVTYQLYGFYQPVDMNGVYNVVKNGSTVPLKFEIFAGSTELTDVSAVKSLTFAQTTCSAMAITDEIETLATGGTSLRYDSTGGQFIFNWKTPNTSGKCYRVTMTTQDLSSIIAYFKLK